MEIKHADRERQKPDDQQRFIGKKSQTYCERTLYTFDLLVVINIHPHAVAPTLVAATEPRRSKFDRPFSAREPDHLPQSSKFPSGTTASLSTQDRKSH
eukprot:6213836-Pleurochrysis_carterae.AAC.2